MVFLRNFEPPFASLALLGSNFEEVTWLLYQEGDRVRGAVEMIGPIRQELLSGIREPSKFACVRDRLRCFPDLEIGTADSEEAAVLSTDADPPAFRDRLPISSSVP